MEAIESKTPVIYTDKGGAKEILDNGKNGLQINSNSIKESSKLILDYISKKDIQNNRVKNSINFVVKNFNKKSYKINLINLLSKF